MCTHFGTSLENLSTHVKKSGHPKVRSPLDAFNKNKNIFVAVNAYGSFSRQIVFLRNTDG